MGMNIKSTINVEKIEVNEHGDYIAVNASDSLLFDNFVNCYKSIVEISEGMPGKVDAIETKYAGKNDFESAVEKASAISALNVDFSQKTISMIDAIFGEGTIKKYFRNIYEEIPSFLPDVECIIDFFEQITPVMEKIFGEHIKDRKKLRKARMAKYVPQDHKKPGNK